MYTIIPLLQGFVNLRPYGLCFGDKTKQIFNLDVHVHTLLAAGIYFLCLEMYYVHVHTCTH